VAVKTEAISDCVRLKNAVEGLQDHVAIAMGSAGQITRLWPAWIGSRWTYGGSAAPGQIGVRELIDCYRVRQTTAATAVYGVSGSPLGHSASPAMHNAAFAMLGIDAVYLPLETATAAEFVAMADTTRLSGASVTIPLKQALLTPDVHVDDLPRQIGALNTLRRGPRGWEGRNFDAAGFLAPLDARGIVLGNRRVVVLGAGGAARAAVWALRSRGARVEVCARRASAAQVLAKEFGVAAARARPEPGWDVLVNATPVGMWPHAGDTPIDEDALSGAAGKVVYDLVYNPLATRLIQLATAAGAHAIGGLEMLVAQACCQFEWWTGQTAPRDVMRDAAKDFIQARGSSDL
jgi:3-dehydroquinate dehydratase/shikimate dehydrogenase